MKNISLAMIYVAQQGIATIGEMMDMPVFAIFGIVEDVMGTTHTGHADASQPDKHSKKTWTETTRTGTQITHNRIPLSDLFDNPELAQGFKGIETKRK